MEKVGNAVQEVPAMKEVPVGLFTRLMFMSYHVQREAIDDYDIQDIEWTEQYQYHDSIAMYMSFRDLSLSFFLASRKTEKAVWQDGRLTTHTHTHTHKHTHTGSGSPIRVATKRCLPAGI